MNRREVLSIGIGALAATGLGAAPDVLAVSHAEAKGHAGLVDAVNACVTTGEACVQHCLRQLAADNTQLAKCAQAVHDMLAVCRAMGPLVLANSAHLAKAAPLCAAVCADCEKACREHADHHPECKACADACAATIQATRALAPA